MSSRGGEEDIDRLKVELVVLKRNFTRQVNNCGRSTTYATHHPTSDAASAVCKNQEKLDTAYNRLIDVLDTLNLNDPVEANRKSYETQTSDRTDLYQDIVKRCLATLEEINKPTTVAPNAQPQPAGAAAAAAAGGSRQGGQQCAQG